jgi:hypothetical protein
MQIVGKWHSCDDGIIRPIVETSYQFITTNSTS